MSREHRRQCFVLVLVHMCEPHKWRVCTPKHYGYAGMFVSIRYQVFSDTMYIYENAENVTFAECHIYSQIVLHVSCWAQISARGQFRSISAFISHAWPIVLQPSLKPSSDWLTTYMTDRWQRSQQKWSKLSLHSQLVQYIFINICSLFVMNAYIYV